MTRDFAELRKPLDTLFTAKNELDKQMTQIKDRMNVLQERLQRQNQNTNIATEKLNNELMIFAAYKKENEDLLLQRRLIADKTDEGLVMRELELNKKTKEVNDRAIRLADERGVLDRAWKELQRKQGQ